MTKSDRVVAKRDRVMAKTYGVVPKTDRVMTGSVVGVIGSLVAMIRSVVLIRKSDVAVSRSACEGPKSFVSQAKNAFWNPSSNYGPAIYTISFRKTDLPLTRRNSKAALTSSLNPLLHGAKCGSGALLIEPSPANHPKRATASRADNAWDKPNKPPHRRRGN